jgi:hypothetical protein
MDNLFFTKFYVQGLSSEMIDSTLFNYRERPRPLGAHGERESLSDSDLGLEIQRYLNHQVDFYIESCREVLYQFKKNEVEFFLFQFPVNLRKRGRKAVDFIHIWVEFKKPGKFLFGQKMNFSFWQVVFQAAKHRTAEHDVANRGKTDYQDFQISDVLST